MKIYGKKAGFTLMASSSSNVSTLSSGLIQSYINYSPLSSVSTEDTFRAISLQIGGDGNTITKDTLDSYIENADSDTADLAQLKTLQSSWYKISSGNEEISPEDISSNKDYKNLFFSALTSNISSTINSSSLLTDEETSLSATDKVYGYLIDAAVNGSTGTNSSQYDLLNSYLSKLLSAND